MEDQNPRFPHSRKWLEETRDITQLPAQPKMGRKRFHAEETNDVDKEEEQQNSSQAEMRDSWGKILGLIPPKKSIKLLPEQGPFAQEESQRQILGGGGVKWGRETSLSSRHTRAVQEDSLSSEEKEGEQAKFQSRPESRVPAFLQFAPRDLRAGAVLDLSQHNHRRQRASGPLDLTKRRLGGQVALGSLQCKSKGQIADVALDVSQPSPQGQLLEGPLDLSRPRLQGQINGDTPGLQQAAWNLCLYFIGYHIQRWCQVLLPLLLMLQLLHHHHRHV
nr:uncharacterized protein LOC118076268 isoform X2 [Zootoca vivipara]